MKVNNSVATLPLSCTAEFKKGDNISEYVLKSIDDNQLTLQDGDIIVITHKVISKSEGYIVDLTTVKCSEEALKYAELSGKDPHLLQVILDDSAEVLHYGLNRPFITRHKQGYVAANSAVDQSNTGNKDHAIRLPENSDKSAKEIRHYLESKSDTKLAVIIIDTHGRAFRKGSMGVALGVSGISALKSFIGLEDRDGRTLSASVDAQADLLASAALLVMGQAAENTPFALIRGYKFEPTEGSGADLIRDPQSDYFTGGK